MVFVFPVGTLISDFRGISTVKSIVVSARTSPSALSMLISALYTIIDGIFVGQGVGDSALAAVNIVLPFTVMVIGIANMMAVGGGALVSKNIGANKIDKAVNFVMKEKIMNNM